jgi:hypothetical protein
MGPARLLRLDAKGNVVWARELPNADFGYLSSVLDPNMRVLSDGSSLVVHRLGLDPTVSIDPAANVERTDAEGNSS